MQASELESHFGVLLDVDLEVTAELGACRLPIASILELGTGSIVHFSNSIEQPIRLLVNGRCIARGEIVAVDDRYALRITEVVSAADLA